jgi:hypothetical protein
VGPRNSIQYKSVVSPQGRRRMLEHAKLISPVKKGPKLDEVFKQWIKERQPIQNTQAEYERAKQIFVSLNGDHPINE